MDIIQPTSIFDLSQEIEEGGGGGISWFDSLCQQWFRKLIVSYCVTSCDYVDSER